MTAPTFFTVVADYKSVVVDLASDVDADPQLGPITAKVTFTPVLAKGDVILATNASPRPTGYLAAPIVARIDGDGRLKLRVEPDGDRDDFATTANFPATGTTAKVYYDIAEATFYRWSGSAYVETLPYAEVRLLADTALLELDGDLFYKVTFSEVTFNGASGYISPFTFQAPTSDTVLNLIEVTPVPGQPASGITKIAPGAVRLEDGEVVFSFGGVDIADPLELVVNAVAEAEDITDSTLTGRSLITAANAAAARTAIGATATGSAVFTAANPLRAHQAVGENHRADLTTSFRYKADANSAPATGDEGVAVTIVDVPPLVKDGLLQSPNITSDPNNRATYFNQPLVGGKRIGATFKLSAGSGGLISAGLIFWEYPIPTPYKIPNSPIHLVVNKSGWELAVFHSGVNPGTDATFSSIGSGSFSPTLAEDWNPAVVGTGTLHRIEALIHGTSATIFLPDGSVARVSDSRIGSIPANVACWEHFHGTGVAGKLGFEDIWASTSADLPIGAVDLESTQSISNKTLTSSTLTSPRISGDLKDANGNTALALSSTASAVNHVWVVNTVSGVSPVILPAGATANLNLQVRSKGSGSIDLQDSNAKSIAGFGSGSASAVNYFNLFNSGTGADVSMYANGTDTNIGINVVPKGSGTLKSNGTAVILNGGALGTPSSATLTNATGLPVSGITASTSAALGVGSVELGHATDTTISRSSAGKVAVEGIELADSIDLGERLTSGEATMNRRLAGTTLSVPNGTLRLAYFTATKSETITSVRTVVSVAGAGSTLQRIGVYSVAGNGDLTLIASTPNDTALWIANGLQYSKSFSDSFSKVRGTRYAVGTLVVGSSTAPTLWGSNVLAAAEMAEAPRLSAILTSQTDLPASAAAGTLTNSSAALYSVLLP
jgi:hypothetical protein